jgi:hypothetical protein
MKKQRRFLVLLWVLGSMVLFSGGALAAAAPDNDYSSHSLSSTIVTADSSANPGEQAAQTPFEETREGGSLSGTMPADLLVADFGVMGALCLYTPGIGWSQLATASSNLMVQALNRNLVANFPGFGLYRYDLKTWALLTPNDSAENLLGVGSALYADFGPIGLWRYDAQWQWVNLSYSNPNKLQEYRGHLVANFPGYGLYEHDGATWTLLTPNDTVQALITIQHSWLSTNLYADFGTQGLWKYDGSWAQITVADANILSSWDQKLIANFPGDGLWQYDGTTWKQINSNDTAQALIEAPAYLYADYGAGGLWTYISSWERITSADANLLGSYMGSVVANFPGHGGLYKNNGSGWVPMTSNDCITNMVVLKGY